MNPAPASELLIRAVDADSTYVSFRWLDNPDHPIVHAIPASTMRRLLARLDSALITTDADTEIDHPTGDAEGDAVRKALSGQFTRYWSEYTLSEAFARAIVPAQIMTEIGDRARHGRISIRVTPSRSLARVPLELLVIDDDQRLIELADVVYEPPAALHRGRARTPEPWTGAVPQRPVLYLVDPRLPAGSGLRQVLATSSSRGLATTGGSTNEGLFRDRIVRHPTTDLSGIGRAVSRWDLSEELNESRPSRLFYFGHVSSTVDQPGSAAIHMYDDEQVWGLAASVNRAHRPLTALDLLLGTANPEVGPEDADPVRDRRSGHQWWPMPPRVAVIACEGGVDYRSSETFGLLVAMFGGGAQIVTTTRWTLPSDAAFDRFAGVTAVPGPTTELALAVDDTHTTSDPSAALAEWQRTKLQQWRDTPGPATSPLTWAAVGTHVCGYRPVTAGAASASRGRPSS